MKQRDEKPVIYPFGGQGRFLTGANACTSIAISALARLSKMDAEEFFNTFPPKELEKNQKTCSDEILRGIVQTGIDINKKISGSFVEQLSKKSSQEVNEKIENLSQEDKKFGAINSVGRLEERVIMQDENIQEQLPAMWYDIIEENLKKYQTEGISAEQLGFIATTQGHTTAFFQRTDSHQHTYYISVDSGASFFNLKGQMEIHDNIDSLANSLANKWKQAKQQIDVTVYTTNLHVLDKIKGDQIKSENNHVNQLGN